MVDNAEVGAAVIVYRESEGNLEFLILHRAHRGSDFEGDWAWTPPSGHKEEGETALECAKRELFEETRLTLDLKETDLGPRGIAVFVARAGDGDVVVLDEEHDRFKWADLETVLAKCRPERVAYDFERVARDVRA